MHGIQKRVERLATLTAATSAIGGLPVLASAQAPIDLPGSSPSILSGLSFSNMEEFRRQQYLADIGLAERPSLFGLFPGKKLELNFGQQGLFSFAEDRYAFSYNSKYFTGGFDRFNFKGKSSLTRMSMQSQFNLGSSNVLFNGFQIGDGDNSIDRQLFNFNNGDKFSLKAERVSIDKDFNRIADLPDATPEEKKRLEAERGFERMDFSARFNPSKGLSFSTDRFNATAKDSDAKRSGFRDFASLSFGPNGSFSFLNEGNSVTDASNKTVDRTHQLLSLGFNSKGFSFSGLHDTQSVDAPGSSSKITTSSMALTGQGGLPFKAFAENKTTTVNSFKEDSQLVDLQLQPTKSISLHGRFHNIDRNEGESSSFSAFDWSAALSSRVHFSGIMTNFTSDSGNSLEVNRFALLGEPLNGFKIGAMQETQEGERFGSRRIYDFNLASTQPIIFKPFSQISFSGRHFKSDLNGQTEHEITAANVSGSISNVNFSAEHLDIIEPSGATKKEQSITLSRNVAKEKLTGSIQYKTRESSAAPDSPRTINAQVNYRTGENSNISLRYSLKPENEKREILPRSDFSLSYQTASNGMQYNATIGQSYDYRQDYRSTRVEFGTSGTLKDGSRLSASLGGLMEERPSGDLFTPLIGLSYDRKISDDNFINLQTNYSERGWQLKLEAKHRF